MADQNNGAFLANLNSPTQPGWKSAVSFSVHFWKDRFYVVSYSNNSGHSHSAYSRSRRDRENAPYSFHYF